MQASNQQLLERVQAGDTEAFEDLIVQNMGLVKGIALRFCGRGTDYEDLVQIGTIGMMKAARSFDPSYGTVFSTYAVPLIIGEIRRSLRDDGMLKVSRAIKQSGSKILREKECFCREYGREPKTGELAQRCGMTEGELVYALEAVSPIRSFEEPVGEEDGLTLEQVIADPGNEIDLLTERIALRQAIATLTPVQQKIIELRYGKELSQEQTGQILGMTQVKISREEKKIMLALRQLL